MDVHKFFYLFLLPILCPLSISAQSTAGRLFSTQEVDRRLTSDRRDLIQEKIRIEDHVTAFCQSGAIQPVTIPVVFHIVQPASAPAISLEQVHLQLEALNRDFNTLDPKVYRMKGDYEIFIERAAVPRINFCLPDLSVGADGSSPLTFTSVGVMTWSSDDKVKLPRYGGIAPLDPNRYLNVWVCDLEGENAGYAQMPGGPPETDGVVIDLRYFGMSDDRDNPYGEGKTLTHLVANYLGLYDLWNVYEPCFDDRVYDTPVHNSPNAGVGLEGRHVSTCIGHELEMFMNYMDNTEDSILYMFTKGQVMRMQGILSEGGPRHGLVTNVWCDDNSGTETLSAQRAPADLADEPSLQVYPNPAENILHITVSSIAEGEVHIELFNATGQVVWAYVGACNDGRLDHSVQCEHWPSGIYTVSVLQNRHLMTKKVIIH